MGRGKQGTEAARRRLEMALEHIDHLTEQLADEKIKRKAAEVRAAHLEGIESRDRSWEEVSRALLDEARRKLGWWKRAADEDCHRRTAAFKDLSRLMSEAKLPRGTTVEDFELINKRYPALMSALTAGHSEEWADVTRLPNSRYHHFERRLHGTELARFQRLVGERTTLNADKDLSVDWADALEARQAGFSPADALAYATGDEDPLRRRDGQLIPAARGIESKAVTEIR